MQLDEYSAHLSGLAAGLNGDNQNQEALGVANRCLQAKSQDIPCLLEKAKALFSLGRLSEAMATIDGALPLGAISTVDAASKQALQRLRVQVNAALNERLPSPNNQNSTTLPPTGSAAPADVTGHISCAPGAVGLSIDIDGEISATTLERVGRLFDEYHFLHAKFLSLFVFVQQIQLLLSCRS